MASNNRPGVEIQEELRAAPATATSPTLVPVVVGVCKQIIEVMDSEGALNPDAKYAEEKYNQASLSIPQSSFPDPRDNIDEVNIDEASVKGFLYFGGQLLNLPRGSHGSYGKSFLEALNLSTRAAVRSSENGTITFDAVVGNVLLLALDVVNPLDMRQDITVTFVGALTMDEIADLINEAAGQEVASVIDYLGNDYLQIASSTFGATSSVTLRAGASALKYLFGAGFDDSKEYRVEGAGFRGQDDGDDDLSTPWIEFYRGAYCENGTDTPFPGMAIANTVWAGLIDQESAFNENKVAAVTFTGPSATTPLVAATSSKPGDQFWADGAQVGGAEIIRLEPTRFKLGKLNVSLSTFDDEGVATTRVYDTVEVNNIYHGNAFAPKYTYFVADGLVFGSVLPAGVAATLTGSPPGTVFLERPAILQSSADITFPAALAGLTLDYVLTEDGVTSDIISYTFTGGPFANIAALVADLTGELPGIIIGNVGDRLVLSTTKTGADQGLAVKSTGSSNYWLQFSTTVDTTDTGKDIEYAEPAYVIGELISLPMAWASALDLELIIVDSKGTHTLSTTGVDFSSATTMGDVADAIAAAFSGAAPRTLYDGAIPVAVVATSDDLAAYGVVILTTYEGGTTVSLSVTATDGTDGFRHLGFYDAVGGEWAEIVSSAVITLPVALLNGLTLTFNYNGAPVLTQPAVAGADGSLTAAALAAALNADPLLTDVAGNRVVWYIGDDTPGSEALIVRTVLGGALISVAGTAAAGNVHASISIGAGVTDTGVDAVSNSEADGLDGLKSTVLGFWLDDNPYEYESTFTTNSLQDAIDEVNRVVNGATDVASEDSSFMVLTSLLYGSASKVEINDVSTGAIVLGLSGEDLGAGRPNPDFYLDGSGSVVVGPSILRNGTTGQPFSLESALADVYIQYEGLRLDVSAAAEHPALLTFGDIDEMIAAIGPVSTKNPLALAMFLAMSNAPGINVSGVGLDEANDAAPEGTIDAWARALDFLESREIYSFAPLTSDPYVNQLISTHTQSMSLPTNRGERICTLWEPVPFIAPPTTVSSGTDAETNGTDDSLTLEKNPSSDLIAAGIDITGTILVSEGLYIEVLVVEGGASDLRRYSVEEVNGVLLVLRTSFTGTENEDGFYSTSTLDGSGGFINLDWSLKIRGEELLIAGTTRRDLNAVAAAAGEQAEPYNSRRVYFMFCNALDTSVDGVTQRVEGYYASAAMAGMDAAQNPSQPFTNLPITGFLKVYGTDDTFSEDQMDTIADGGRTVLVNQGGRVVARHSRSTATATIVERERSITKQIDWLAKGLRDTNRVFIGRYVISAGFFDQLTMSNEGFLDLAEQLKVVQSADLKQILQDEDNPDTILIEVEVQPLYPCNKIKITIVV